MIDKISSLLCCALLIAGCSTIDDDAQGKIVSINPCTDAILLELADPEQIGAISHYSHDKNASSADINLAKKFPSIGQSAEEIIALKPSLVLAGGHLSPSTLQALQNLDIKVLQSPVANSIEQSHDQIRDIANAIDQKERGDALINKINISLDTAKSNNDAIPAIIWQGGGLVPGKDTLVDELLSRTGFQNIAHHYGLSQWDIIGLERLSANPPAIILRGGNRSERLLNHPILDDIETEIADFPQSLIWCAGPTIAKAANKLSAIRQDYQNGITP